MIAVRLRSLREDRRATALIEFAVTLPVLALLFLGGYQLSDASACKRKTTTVARAVADMISQYTIISQSEVNTVLGASTQIMTPYPVANAQIRVSEITVGNKGNGKVTWSCGLNTTPRTFGTKITNMPADLRTAADVYIFAEVTYNYDGHLGNLVPPMSFTQTIYMLPRKSTSVTFQDSGDAQCSAA